MIPTYVVATSTEAARLKSIKGGIAVVYAYYPEDRNYAVADLWVDGEAVYSVVGGLTRTDAIEHAERFLEQRGRT